MKMTKTLALSTGLLLGAIALQGIHLIKQNHSRTASAEQEIKLKMEIEIVKADNEALNRVISELQNVASQELISQSVPDCPTYHSYAIITVAGVIRYSGHQWMVCK